jgi:hypothetical protein
MSSGHEAQREPKAEGLTLDAGGKSATELPPDVLADIVAETTAQLAPSTPTDPALQAALLDVARQFAGQAMTVEPTGVAFMAAVLRTQFPLLQSRPQLLARVAEMVAESLLSDPTARQRIEYLWAKLSEEVA